MYIKSMWWEKFIVQQIERVYTKPDVINHTLTCPITVLQNHHIDHSFLPVFCDLKMSLWQKSVPTFHSVLNTAFRIVISFSQCWCLIWEYDLSSALAGCSLQWVGKYFPEILYDCLQCGMCCVTWHILMQKGNSFLCWVFKSFMTDLCWMFLLWEGNWAVCNQKLHQADVWVWKVIVMMFVSLTGIFVTASQSSDSAYSYNTVTVVLLTEVVKLLVSTALYCRE
jgi:hypothetical protein